MRSAGEFSVTREDPERFADQVRGHWKKIGFDMPAMLARRGVRMERDEFTAPAGMQ